jgi:hypothetical protein
MNGTGGGTWGVVPLRFLPGSLLSLAIEIAATLAKPAFAG